MTIAEESKLYRPSAAELQAGLGVIRAIAETIRDVHRAPRGTIYAALMGHGVDYSAYQRIESILVNSGLVRIESDCLVWQAERGQP